MKKIFLLPISFVIFNLISCVSTGKPSDSNYLLKSYSAPVDYEITKDEMTGLESITSPGIVLYAALYGWNNTCMWLKKTGEGSSAYRIIVSTNQKNWYFFDTLYIKINDEVLKFSTDEKNFSNDRNVLSQGNVGEFNACYMNKETLEKIITAESINISLRGSKGKLDYTIPKQEKWQKMLEY